MPTTKLTDATVRKTSPPQSGYLELWDSVLPGFGLRIGYGGRRSFIVQTRVNGRQRRFTVGTFPALTLGKARDRARELLQDAAEGVDPKQRERADAQQAERIQARTFNAAADRFIEEHAKPRNRTWYRAQQQIDKELRPVWGELQVDQIARADVREVIRGKAATHPIGANRLLATVRKFFNWCVEQDLVTTSPAAGVKPPAPERERERVLGQDEIKAVWSAFGHLGYPYGPMFRLLLLTGQRRSEVAHMRWSEIDFGNALWTLSGTRTKAGRLHEVPLSPQAVRLLEELPRIGDFVFATRADAPAVSFSSPKRRVDRWAELPPWTLHDLRRTSASYMAWLGFAPSTISHVLNHSEGGVTRIYNRYSYLKEKRQALDCWGAELERIVQGKGDRTVVPLQA